VPDNVQGIIDRLTTGRIHPHRNDDVVAGEGSDIVARRTRAR
jgi:hypothetical protein